MILSKKKTKKKQVPVDFYVSAFFFFSFFFSFFSHFYHFFNGSLAPIRDGHCISECLCRRGDPDGAARGSDRSRAASRLGRGLVPCQAAPRPQRSIRGAHLPFCRAGRRVHRALAHRHRRPSRTAQHRKALIHDRRARCADRRRDCRGGADNVRDPMKMSLSGGASRFFFFFFFFFSFVPPVLSIFLN
jgi:hypothetical protein